MRRKTPYTLGTTVIFLEDVVSVSVKKIDMNGWKITVNLLGGHTISDLCGQKDRAYTIRDEIVRTIARDVTFVGSNRD